MPNQVNNTRIILTAANIQTLAAASAVAATCLAALTASMASESKFKISWTSASIVSSCSAIALMYLTFKEQQNLKNLISQNFPNNDVEIVLEPIADPFADIHSTPLVPQALPTPQQEQDISQHLHDN